jgi:hypothetical protein
MHDVQNNIVKTKKEQISCVEIIICGIYAKDVWTLIVIYG